MTYLLTDPTSLASIASTSSGQGDALVGVKSGATGAVATTQHQKNAQSVDLTDFGTVDITGVADCSAVFALAIAAFGYGGSTYGRVINLPAGKLKANFVIQSGSITIRGKGKNATVLVPNTNAAVVSIGLIGGSVQDVHLEEMGFDNSAGTATGTTAAVLFPAVIGAGINDCHILRNVKINRFPIGVDVAGRLILATMDGVEITNSGTYGWRVFPAAGGTVNHLRFVNSRADGAGTHGCYLNGTNNALPFQGVGYDHCDFEHAGYDYNGTSLVGNTNAGAAGVWAQNVDGLNFSGQNYFENNGPSASDNKGTGIRITGAYSQWFKISGCLLWSSQNGVVIDAQQAIGYIGENRINGNSINSLNISNQNQNANIVIGPNYDGGTHNIAIDAYGSTRTKFLAAPDSARTINVTLADGMDVTGQEFMYAQNSGAITLATFINGEIGQEISVFTGSAPVTFTHGGVSANGFFLPGLVSQTIPPYSIIKFVRVQYRAWLCVGIAAGPRSLLMGNGVATAATIAPNLDFCHIVNTGAISLMTIPYAGWTGQVTLIPDAAWTLATGGVQSGLNYPIALASTAVVSKAMTLTFDGVKWYPSY